MTTWSCVAGSTLLIPSGIQGHHLFVVLTDPMNFYGYPPQSCISVSLCTIRSTPYDSTCVVQPGEHPFVISPSYISYRHSRFDTDFHLKEMIKNHFGFPQEPTSTELLAKIYSGVHSSKQTPNIFKQLLP